MPSEPPDPLVTDDFIEDVRTSYWDSGHLLSRGVVYYLHERPARVGPGTWERATAGLTLSIETYRILFNATANGSAIFTSGGVRYALRETLGSAVAVPV